MRWVLGVIDDARHVVRVAGYLGWRSAPGEWRARRRLRADYDRNVARLSRVLQ